MHDFFEPGNGTKPVDPHQSARQSARPALRHRFYKTVATAVTAEGFAITLDSKQVRTPSGRTLIAPRAVIADALRQEWDVQRPAVDPAKMPLTRLANSIVDGVADRAGETADDLLKYLGSDLLFYRADGPDRLVARQTAAWDPVVRWAAENLGARFVLAQGIVHARQPDHAIEAARWAIPTDPWTLGALHSVTTLTGSALLALAMMHRFADANTIWRAANVDEDWNFETWGYDDLAMARRAAREEEFQVAALIIEATQDPESRS